VAGFALYHPRRRFARNLYTQKAVYLSDTGFCASLMSFAQSDRCPLWVERTFCKRLTTSEFARTDIPLVAIKVMNLGDRYQPRYPNEPILQRRNDPGSTFMGGSFPALARY
jgi:hypothetical protein